MPRKNSTLSGISVSAGIIILSGNSFSLRVNGADREINGDPDTPLLWALRDLVGLTGTKFGCGIGACGACTVQLDGELVRSCQIPLADIGKAEITTIEGLSGSVVSAVRAAWITQDVVQCGYCQPGQIMAASTLLSEIPAPTPDDITTAMDGNICRCGSYNNIRAAIQDAAKTLASG